MRVSVIVLTLVGSSAARGVKRQTGPVESNTNPYCTYYDTAYSKLDDCAYFEDFWAISHKDFVAWNPSVRDDCSGLRVGNSYCVQASQAPPSQATEVPTSEGLTASCTTLYKAVDGDNCLGIVARFGTFSRTQFLSWNPAVGSNCEPGPKAGMFYCVGTPDTPNKPTPSVPTQDGLSQSCTMLYKAVDGDNCLGIVAKFNTFSRNEFLSWNPAVGSDCRPGPTAGQFYCVGVPGTPTKPINSLDCSSSDPLWGENRPGALSDVVDWCDGKDKTDGSGGFATGQSKHGCFNAPYGNNKIEFWLRNDFGTGSYLSVDLCNTIMNTAVNQCPRGGTGMYESWYYKAMVGSGRC